MNVQSDLLPITLDDMIAELERECVLRQRVYPRFVGSGKLRQDVADRQLNRMEAALQTLVDLRAKK